MKPKKMSQRAYQVIAALIGVGLLVALGFSLSALFAPRTQQPVQPVNQLEPEERPTVSKEQPSLTADWKVYRSEEYGFQIKYPRRWVLKEREKGYRDAGGDETQTVAALFSTYPFSAKEGFAIYLGVEALGGLTLEEFSNPLSEWEQRRESPEWDSSSLSPSEEELRARLQERRVVIGGREGIWQEAGGVAGAHIRVFIPLSSDKILVVYSFGTSDGTTIRPEDEQLFNQVLETLRFLDQ